MTSRPTASSNGTSNRPHEAERAIQTRREQNRQTARATSMTHRTIDEPGLIHATEPNRTLSFQPNHDHQHQHHLCISRAAATCPTRTHRTHTPHASSRHRRPPHRIGVFSSTSSGHRCVVLLPTVCLRIARRAVGAIGWSAAGPLVLSIVLCTCYVTPTGNKANKSKQLTGVCFFNK